MAGTVNKVILIGHLGDEVKMHYFEGGNSIGRFPLATNETYISKQTGERITNTDWHNIVVRNKLAEICEKYLVKGDKIYIEGRLKNRQWEQEGQKRYTTEVHVQEMTMLSNKKGTNTATQQEKSVLQAPQNTQKKAETKLEEEDDLPF